MSNPSVPLTLVTVTSPDFLPGTRVMLDSFIVHNPWFKGDMIAVHTGLSDAEQSALMADFPALRLMTPPAPLTEALDKLAGAQPPLAGRIARFHSLSTFWIEAKADILFCDSDIVFTGEIASIFEHEGLLLAAPDRAMLQGNHRDAETLEELASAQGGSLFHSFNAGLMVMRAEMRSAENRMAILEGLGGDFWADLRSKHTDQALLYRLFGDAVTLLDQRFNRLVGHAASLRGVTGSSLEEALVLHFNGPVKPWRLDRHSDAARADGLFVKALQIWLEAHTRLLTRQHFDVRLPKAGG